VVSFVQAYSSRIFYFNKKTQEFIENKDSENRENLPKDYYSKVGVHPYKMFKDFCCIPTRESTGDRVYLCYVLMLGHQYILFVLDYKILL
jgi:hypothetical protein